MKMHINRVNKRLSKAVSGRQRPVLKFSIIVMLIAGSLSGPFAFGDRIIGEKSQSGNVFPQLSVECEKEEYLPGEHVNLTAFYNNGPANITFEVDDPKGTPIGIFTNESFPYDFIDRNDNHYGLIGEWTFDEGTGQAVGDTTGSGNHGQLGSTLGVDKNDPAWINGISGSALEFDGDDDYVSLPEGDNILGISRDFSIGCFIRPDSFGSDSQAILDLNYQAPNDNRGNGMLIFLAPDYKVSINLYLADDADGKLYRLKGNADLRSSKTYHIAVTRDMNDLRIYLNGVEDGFGVVSGSDVKFTYDINNHMGDFNTIGTGRKQQGTEHWRYDGLIDELSVYDRALDAVEIAAQYKALLPSPIARWSMDEGTGPIVSDSSVNGNHGQLGSTYGEDDNDPIWVNGISGNALSFDGYGDYVDVPDNIWSENLTLEAWINVNDFGDPDPARNGKLIISKAPDTGTARDYSLVVGTDGTKTYASFIFGEGPDEYASLISELNLVTNTWYHLAATRENCISKLYINGVLDNSLEYDFTPTDHNYDLKIGMGHKDHQSFDGVIDEISIYDRSLDAVEIASRYNALLPVPLARWSMDDGMGTNVSDSSGNSNHGELNVGWGDNANSKWVEGVRGKALKFDGTNDYVDIANYRPVYSTSTSFTWEAWIKTSYTGPEAMEIMGGRYSTSSMTDNIEFVIYLGYFRVSIRDENDITSHYLNQDIFVADGDWHHVILERDTRDDCFSLYNDGEKKSTWSDNSTGDIRLTGLFRIGNEYYTGGTATGDRYQFNGIIDKVSIYEHSLAAKEIDDNYHFSSEIQACYSFKIPEEAIEGTYTVYVTNNKDGATDSVTFNVTRPRDPKVKSNYYWIPLVLGILVFVLLILISVKTSFRSERR